MTIKNTETGKLVYSEAAPYPDYLDGFHSWRCTWCTTHRKSWSPPGLREGKLNFLTLLFYFYHKLF